MNLIYVCEDYHDNDRGIFSTPELAVKFAESDEGGAEVIQEMRLESSGEYKATERTWWPCEVCRKYSERPYSMHRYELCPNKCVPKPPKTETFTGIRYATNMEGLT